MNMKIKPLVKGLDSILYWSTVSLFIFGMITADLLPPKIDVVAFAGFIFACFVLKPLIVSAK